MTTVNVNQVTLGIESFGDDDAPLVLLAGGAAAVGAAAWKWRKASTQASVSPAAPLDPDVERRIDEELARFES